MPESPAHGRPISNIVKEATMDLFIGEEAEEHGIVDDRSIPCGEAGEISRRWGTLSTFLPALNPAPNAALNLALIRGCSELCSERIGITRVVHCWFLINYIFGFVGAVVGGRLILLGHTVSGGKEIGAFRA